MLPAIRKTGKFEVALPVASKPALPPAEPPAPSRLDTLKADWLAASAAFGEYRESGESINRAIANATRELDREYSKKDGFNHSSPVLSALEDLLLTVFIYR